MPLPCLSCARGCRASWPPSAPGGVGTRDGQASVGDDGREPVRVLEPDARRGGASTVNRGGPTAAQLASRRREMIRALNAARRELSDRFARPSYQALARSRGWPSAHAISRHFGSWVAACEAAGVKRAGWADVEDGELLDLLREDTRRRGRALANRSGRTARKGARAAA